MYIGVGTKYISFTKKLFLELWEWPLNLWLEESPEQFEVQIFGRNIIVYSRIFNIEIYNV